MANKLFKVLGSKWIKVPDTIHTVQPVTLTTCRLVTDTIQVSDGTNAVVSPPPQASPIINSVENYNNLAAGGAVVEDRYVTQTNGDSVRLKGVSRYIEPVFESATRTVCTTKTVKGYTRRVPNNDIRLDAPIEGWDGSALSTAKMSGHGEFIFSVPSYTVGAIVGLNQLEGLANSDYQDIDYAFIFTRGNVSILENGAYRKSIGAGYTESDIFAVKRVNGVITYFKNGTLVYRSPTQNHDVLYLDASLYLSNDEILNAEFAPLTVSPTTSHKYGLPVNGAGYSVIQFASQSTVGLGYYSVNDAVIVPHQSFSSTSAFTETRTHILSSESFTSVSVFSTDGESGNQSVSTLRAIDGIASEHSGATSINSFTAMEGQAYEGLVTIDIGEASALMPPLVSQSRVISGGVVTAQLQEMGALRGFASDHPYSESINEMVDLRSVAGSFPARKVGAARLVNRIIYGQGSSILLPTGRHLLTAAHVVKKWTDLNAVDVDFITDDGVTLPTYKPYRVTIHPDYDDTVKSGHPDFAKNDLAIVELTEFVDPIVKRHGIYAGTNELAKVYERTSYSPRINPNTGSLTGTKGWDLTRNSIDEVGQYFLRSDYDTGLEANNAIGSLGVDGEGGVSGGDSGSAILVDGIIYGILSFGTSYAGIDVTNKADGSYGELIADVRISSYTDWIIANSVTTTPYYQPNPFLPGSFSVARAANAIIELDFLELEVVADSDLSPIPEADIGLPVLEVEAVSGAVSGIDAIEFSVEAESELQLIASADLPLLDFTVESAGNVGGYATVDIEGLDTYEIEAYNGAIASMAMPDFTLSAEVQTSTVAEVSLTLFDLAIESRSSNADQASSVEIGLLDLETVFGEAGIDLQLWELDSYSYSARLAESSKSYAVNVLHEELFEYENYNFSKILKLAGNYYGVRNDGLYLLEGADDDGAKIEAVFRTADMDFGTAQHKRVPYVYMDTVDRTITEPYAEGERVGKYASNFKGRRTRLARGKRGRFWAFEVSNVEGGPLDLRSLEIHTNVVGRKV